MSKPSNCVTYFSDIHIMSEFKFRPYCPKYLKVMGTKYEGSPSECLWLIPTWEVFEQASI